MIFSFNKTTFDHKYSTQSSFFAIFGSAITCLTLMSASNAFALISGELDVGSRTSKWSVSGQESEALKASTVEAAVHLDPIPLVPVSFGLRLVNDSYKVSMAEHGMKSLTSAAIVPEVAAWFPFGSLKPFIRLGYTLISTYKASADSVLGAIDIAYKASGSRMTLGLEYSLIPFVALTAAYENSTEKLDVSEAKMIGVDVKSQIPDSKITSNAMLLGVKVGI